MLIDGAVGIFHHKHKFEGQKLDMTYITPQLIAAAMPTDRYIQGFYRMSAKSVVDFLDKEHESHWHVWNLQDDSELGYNPNKIRGTEDSSFVTRHPVRDHQPFPFAMLVRIATEIRDYIELDSKNVALVHCKCGKGRTGGVVAAYLILFHGMTYTQAVKAFTQKRVRLGIISGITIKSQQRFLRYIDSWARTQDPHMLSREDNIRIVQVVIRNPRVEDFELDVKALSSPSELDTGVSKWDVTYKEKYYLLRPLAACPKNALPVDLNMHFKGYNRKLGYRIPSCSISYAFNVLFEPNSSIFGTVEDQASQRMLSSLALSSLASTESCICHWEDTDGIGGLELRGIKGFDSVEIFWKPKEEEGPEKGECFSPSSISNL